MPINRRRLLGASLAAIPFTSFPAWAQSWPARPITLVSPYGAGGSSDLLTRMLGESLAGRMGQSFVVENRSGAGTRIANEYVARAAPDGYTVLHAAAPIAIGEALYPKLPYNTKKDFAPMLSTAIAPLFLIVNAEAPYKTLAEFIAFGKSNPNGLTFGSPGAGSAPHLTAELLLRAAGTNGVVVQYRRRRPRLHRTAGRPHRRDADRDLNRPPAHPERASLRVLGVANEERTPAVPAGADLARIRAALVVGYGWYGLMLPAGTPAAIVRRLNTETNAALADPDVRKRAEAVGLQVRGGSPAEFAAFIDSETRKWAQVIKAANIKPE